MRPLKALSFVFGFVVVVGCQGPDEFYRLSNDGDKTGTAGFVVAGHRRFDGVPARRDQRHGRPRGRPASAARRGQRWLDHHRRRRVRSAAPPAPPARAAAAVQRPARRATPEAAGRTGTAGSDREPRRHHGAAAAPAARGAAGATGWAAAPEQRRARQPPGRPARAGTTGTGGAAAPRAAGGGTGGTRPARRAAGRGGSGGAKAAGGAGGGGPDRIQVVAQVPGRDVVQDMTRDVQDPEPRIGRRSSGATSRSATTSRRRCSSAPMVTFDFLQKTSSGGHADHDRDRHTSRSDSRRAPEWWPGSTTSPAATRSSCVSTTTRRRPGTRRRPTTTRTSRAPASRPPSAYADRLTMPGYYQGQLAWGSGPPPDVAPRPRAAARLPRPALSG